MMIRNLKYWILYHLTKPRFRYIAVWGEVYLSKKEAKEKSEDEVIKIIKGTTDSFAKSMNNELFRRYQNWKNEK